MMKCTLLALETSSSRCGVALLRAHEGKVDITLLEHDGAQEHAERLLPMARDLLTRAGLAPDDLDAVAFGQGPGGFTGLRVACGVAQGIAMARGLPVVPVVSLQAVAARVPARPEQVVVVALDARMEEVYLGAYRRVDGAADNTEWEVLQAPVLIAAAEAVPWVESRLPDWRTALGLPLAPVLAGDAWQVYGGVMNASADWPCFDALRPEVRDVAWLGLQAWLRGGVLAPELAAPLYVRDKVAFTTAERTAGQGGNPRAGSALVQAPEPVTLTQADRLALEAAAAEVSATVPAAVVSPEGHAAHGVTAQASTLAADGVPGVFDTAREQRPLSALRQAMQAAGQDVGNSLEAASMRSEDLDDMAALEAAVQAFPWTRRNFADALAAGYESCLLRAQGRLLGFCVLMPAPDVSHLLVIAVDPAWQRRGLGTRLMQWCEARTRAHGLDALLLEVRPSNGKALAFYGRHGFQQIGLRRDYYPAAHGAREDAVIMQKPVAPRGHGDE